MRATRIVRIAAAFLAAAALSWHAGSLAAVVQAVNAAGYRYAYGICRKRDPQFPMLTIPRKVLWERSCLDPLGRFSPAVMNCQTRWAFDAKQYCEHDHVSTIEAAKYGSIA